MQMNQARVRVGKVDELADAALLAGEAWLTREEHARMLSIAAPQRRRQFLAGHWLARVLAAQACGGEPGQWRLETAADPRPRLHCSSRPGLWASISHSGLDVAAGVAHHALGVDLEQSSRERDLVALAHFVLAPEEARQVAELTPGAAQRTCFHRLWTLKEAHAKRSGEGLQPSQARRMAARSCSDAQAEAWHWPLPGSGSLAVAAWPGVQVLLEGADSIASAWRYHPLP